jgi:hypothetical protein
VVGSSYFAARNSRQERGEVASRRTIRLEEKNGLEVSHYKQELLRSEEFDGQALRRVCDLEEGQERVVVEADYG